MYKYEFVRLNKLITNFHILRNISYVLFSIQSLFSFHYPRGNFNGVPYRCAQVAVILFQKRLELINIALVNRDILPDYHLDCLLQTIGTRQVFKH